MSWKRYTNTHTEPDLAQADAVITLSALILVDASPHGLIGTSSASWKAQETSVCCVLRICVVQMMCLLCNAARVQMMSELGLKGSFLLPSSVRIQRVFGPALFNVSGSAGDTVHKHFSVFRL